MTFSIPDHRTGGDRRDRKGTAARVVPELTMAGLPHGCGSQSRTDRGHDARKRDVPRSLVRECPRKGARVVTAGWIRSVNAARAERQAAVAPGRDRARRRGDVGIGSCGRCASIGSVGAALRRSVFATSAVAGRCGTHRAHPARRRHVSTTAATSARISSSSGSSVHTKNSSRCISVRVRSEPVPPARDASEAAFLGPRHS